MHLGYRRGLQVDTSALLSALNSGHITAALDVTDPEPLPQDHPLWKVRTMWRSWKAI